jgi:chaperone modulatory protein CbpM
MQNETLDVLWLDRYQLVSVEELVTLSGLTEADVHELVELGALAPVDHQQIPWAFSADCVVTLRKANRLRDDLELDAHALALALTLLDQIHTLESELARVRARQPVFRRG